MSDIDINNVASVGSIYQGKDSDQGSQQPGSDDDMDGYYTSTLSGTAWVEGLMADRDHPERIRSQLGVHHHVFEKLLRVLRKLGLEDSAHVPLHEQLAIFLYVCVTGSALRHAGERFQRNPSTIWRYFERMLRVFSSPPFSTKYVKLPRAHELVPPDIANNPDFSPFFDNAIGVIDCIQISCKPPIAERSRWRNSHGDFSQNCLIASSFDLRVLYVCSGVEGSTPDAQVYRHALGAGLRIPPGKCYLADARFGRNEGLLIPREGVQNDLRAYPPTNEDEIFNLGHALARRVADRTYSILERRFRILFLPPGCSSDIQSLIPQALCALHNFIRRYDPDEIEDLSNEDASESED